MLDISEDLKAIYRSDRVPLVPELAYKELNLYFPDLDLTIGTDRIVDDSFSLQESLCSADDLELGACEGAILKVTVANLVEDLSGYTFVITQAVNGTYTMPLGTYKIDSCKKQNDQWFREIVAFDSMTKTDVDVANWYNNLSWPQTVKDMRESLLNYLGIPFEVQELTNDNVTLLKTVNPSSLIGKDVLKRLCEINAGFGHITREGKFKVIQLIGLGLYPSETLYPAEDLFPSESGEYVTAGYESAEYEEYVVEPITSVTIREDDEDIGTTEGTPENPYVILGNFLLFGKSSVEMHPIVENILLQLRNKYYRPHETVMMGLPYMEVGDAVTLITSEDAIETFIFRRTLKGIQSLTDEISATGNQFRDQKVTQNTEIEQLKSKTLKIRKDVDQVSIDMWDMESDLQSQITLTAEGLQTQITDNKNDTNSQISQLSDSISFKVSKGDVSSQLSVETDRVYIGSNRLVVDSTNFQLDASGNATFSGFIKGATIDIGDGRFTVNKNGDLFAKTASFGGGNYYITAIDDEGIYIFDKNNHSRILASLWANALDIGYINCEQNVRCSYLQVPALSRIEIGVDGGVYNSIDYYLARKSHRHSSTDVNAVLVGGDNIGFSGKNAAAVTWVQANFQPRSSSDFRLKRNFRPLDELPLELFMELKPYLYEFKCNDLGFSEGTHMGLLAQQIELAFERYELNPFDYNLVEIREPRPYTDEGQYVIDGKIHVVNYTNLIAWTIQVVQDLIRKVG